MYTNKQIKFTKVVVEKNTPQKSNEDNTYLNRKASTLMTKNDISM